VSLVILFLLMILATMLPDLLPSFLSLQRHPPDLWALSVLYLAFRARGFKAVGWGIVIGLVRDSVSLDPLGTHAFVLGALAFIFCEGRRQRGRIDGMGRLVLTGAGVLLASWLYLLRLLPMGASGITFATWIDAIPVALWSALMAAGLFSVLDRYGLLDELCGRTHAFSS
jgi:rod shape-determining protein MreD